MYSGPASEPYTHTARQRNLQALYDDDEKKKMRDAIEQNEGQVQNIASRELLLQMHALLEEREESWLQTEMNRRHVLEASALQRGSLPFPRSPLESFAYPLLTPGLCCPLALTLKDFQSSNNSTNFNSISNPISNPSSNPEFYEPQSPDDFSPQNSRKNSPLSSFNNTVSDNLKRFGPQRTQLKRGLGFKEVSRKRGWSLFSDGSLGVIYTHRLGFWLVLGLGLGSGLGIVKDNCIDQSNDIIKLIK
jgi:hypothetical protein